MRLDKLLLTVPEAAEVLGIGRSQLYKLVLSGELRTIKIGRSRRIPIRALDELIELLTEAA
jgi:excisionase family DNA binding protein